MKFPLRYLLASILCIGGTLPVACASPFAPGSRRAPIHVLFVGDSFTHGRYDPVRQFASGFDTGPDANGAAHVHDLLCPSAAACDAAELVPPTDPDQLAFPAADDTLAARLAFLTVNSAEQYAETGPFGGIPGIVLRLAEEARTPIDVSIRRIQMVVATPW